MIANQLQNLPIYQFESLNQQKDLKHFISTRAGGVSNDDFSSLNISIGTADLPENIIENRHRIAQALEIADHQLVFPRQTHDDRIVHIDQTKLDKGTEWLVEHLQCTDALMTNLPHICIAVIAADCVPLLFYDPKKRVIGAAHAGWRGTVKKVGQKTVQALQNTFDCQPEDLIVGIGPSIGPEVYEVGSEVINAVEDAFGGKQGLVNHENKAGKGFFNLWEANIRQLEEVGVLRNKIECAGICTYSNYKTFFSARRMNGKGGRFAAGIMLT